MENVKFTAHIKANSLYKALAHAAAFVQSEKLTVYFSTKWVRSMKYRVDDGPWKYLDKDAVINFDWDDC